MRRSLIATGAGFVVLGLFWGAWAAVLPSVQRATGASNGALGLALLFVSVGSIPAMLVVAGPAVDRYGPRAVAAGAAAFAAAILLPGLATSVPGLAAALVATGAASGVLDVGINARAARLEDELGRRLMPAMHGLYSVGVLVGAVGAGLGRSAGAGREWILTGVAVAVAVAGIGLASDEPATPTGTRVRRPQLQRALLALGVLAAAGFVVEGGIEGWSALFLERQLDARPDVSGLGPGFFGGAMAAGRFAGQAARLGDRHLLAGGGAVACAGCLIVAAAPVPAVALAGFVLAGLGVSATAPVTFGLAGRGRRDAASAVATVTTVGYVGLLAGPPLVGGIAQATSLRVSFGVLAGVAAAVAAAATRLRL